MTTVVRLLGPPAVERRGRVVAGPRGRKPWGLLAFLLLADRAPSRQRLVSLLFEGADDPRAALRWNLAEMRRGFGGAVDVGGDPLELRLADDVSVDVSGLGRARPDDGLGVPDGELLEGLRFDDSPAFDTWLVVERQRLAADCRALAYRWAMELLAHGRYAEAARIAANAVRSDPLNADLHALMVAGLARAGDLAAAREQVARCTDQFRRELGVAPPDVVAAAAVVPQDGSGASPAAVGSLLDAADAALGAGAVDTGIARLRRAVAGTSAADAVLAGRARLSLASALVHSRGGRGAEVVTLLHEALASAEQCSDSAVGATACRELAFLALQHGERSEVEHWLGRAEGWSPDRLERAGILGVRGMSLSDTGSYDAALDVLQESVDLAAEAGSRRRAAWSATMVGRVHVVRGDATQAALVLDSALADVYADRWTAFAPLPQALRAESALALGDVDAARELLDRAWVLASESGDQCWVTAVAHGQALLAAHDRRDPMGWCHTGLAAAPWYVWLRARLLDVAAGVTPDDREARGLVDELERLATECGLRELAVRALLHRARLGEDEQLVRARALAVDVANPALTRRLERL